MEEVQKKLIDFIESGKELAIRENKRYYLIRTEAHIGLVDEEQFQNITKDIEENVDKQIAETATKAFGGEGAADKMLSNIDDGMRSALINNQINQMIMFLFMSQDERDEIEKEKDDKSKSHNESKSDENKEKSDTDK